MQARVPIANFAAGLPIGNCEAGFDAAGYFCMKARDELMQERIRRSFACQEFETGLMWYMPVDEPLAVLMSSKINKLPPLQRL